MKIIENLKFAFLAEAVQVESDSASRWLKLSGIALTEGVSRNNNLYSIHNLKENDGQSFKWIVGHPREEEEHVVGVGSLKLESGSLIHNGQIRNTARHPDIVESVRDGFLGPSIHACAKKAFKKDGVIHIEGLEIEGVGLVAFQGVKNASIECAIAESYNDRWNVEMVDVSSIEGNDDKMEVAEMSEKNIIEQEELKKKKEEEEETSSDDEEAELKKKKKGEEPEKKEESLETELKIVTEELNRLKEAKKLQLVESIVEINKELKSADLINESEEMLNLIKEYELKLNKAGLGSNAIVESVENDSFNGFVETKDGFTINESLYKKFNQELRERVR